MLTVEAVVSVTAAPASDDTATFCHTLVPSAPLVADLRSVQPAPGPVTGTDAVFVHAATSKPSPAATVDGMCTVHDVPLLLTWSEPTKLTCGAIAATFTGCVAVPIAD